MTLNPAAPSTRAISLLMLAAFGGLALWLFLPWRGVASDGVSRGDLPPSLRVSGEVLVESNDDVVTRLVVPLTVRGDEGIALSEDLGALRAETALSESAAAAVPATFTLDWLNGNDDGVLDPGEQVEMIVLLPERTSIHPGNPLRLVLKPVDGVPLIIEDVLG
jgi:hypothetical protein